MRVIWSNRTDNPLSPADGAPFPGVIKNWTVEFYVIRQKKPAALKHSVQVTHPFGLCPWMKFWFVSRLWSHLIKPQSNWIWWTYLADQFFSRPIFFGATCPKYLRHYHGGQCLVASGRRVLSSSASNSCGFPGTKFSDETSSSCVIKKSATRDKQAVEVIWKKAAF